MAIDIPVEPTKTVVSNNDARKCIKNKERTPCIKQIRISIYLHSHLIFMRTQRQKNTRMLYSRQTYKEEAAATITNRQNNLTYASDKTCHKE